MSYIFGNEFTLLDKDAKLRIIRNSDTDNTVFIVSQGTSEFRFTFDKDRLLKRYVLKTEDVNEIRRLTTGGWEIVP